MILALKKRYSFYRRGRCDGCDPSDPAPAPAEGEVDRRKEKEEDEPQARIAGKRSKRKFRIKD
jgi:hypothetical protein